MRIALVTVLALLVAFAIVWFGNHLSHVGTPDDPNDPAQAGLLTPEVLRYNLAGISDSLMSRVRRGEITDAEFKELMANAADKIVGQIKIELIQPKNAWEYGEIYITARRWPEAKQTLEMAVKAARNDDRRVNDTLRLARVYGELGNVPMAVKTARSVFNSPDGACAPILPATLLEIVPAAAGKGHDPELAKLLEEAIACENRTVVDEKSVPGQAFLMARPFHVRNAWKRIITLYESDNQRDQAEAAATRANEMLSRQAGA